MIPIFIWKTIKADVLLMIFIILWDFIFLFWTKDNLTVEYENHTYGTKTYER